LANDTAKVSALKAVDIANATVKQFFANIAVQFRLADNASVVEALYAVDVAYASNFAAYVANRWAFAIVNQVSAVVAEYIPVRYELECADIKRAVD
jgi:hypothetical protein